MMPQDPLLFELQINLKQLPVAVEKRKFSIKLLFMQTLEYQEKFVTVSALTYAGNIRKI
ncbi:hypothetical protein H6F74_10180 [Trichocoleus sp. FACHB-90]|uniref:hypothetical protein n=1 Tax=Cyanophyceae TaxID=3028117 RepID=UPI0016854F67|nr:hypothetical protein [Trichocoleus sp. FACHB-90]MBD1926608.1 hypothetical protein [Trichocoleus sp. FACHB-90]